MTSSNLCPGKEHLKQEHNKLDLWSSFSVGDMWLWVDKRVKMWV